ncbi:cytochrome P450 [Lentzea sp. NBRC 105346]|uniref:cytochrome P450 n=1 Tax=Lentzea sp. NBRC 105346 TaxID=3032205 RepID=UPI0024A4AFC3|nr:cytochrome P450 [Lentzea sp. NBRC 105346]GLZ30954.1 cytochrome P450 [Lentzea sp. NBRC 105346]
MTPPVLPGRLPLVGHALTLVRRPLELMSGADPDDDIAVLYGGWQPWYLVSSPELAQQIFVEDARKFDRGMIFEAVARIVGKTSLTADGDLHRQRRRLVQPTLDRRRIPEYAPTMASAAHDLVASWRDGERLPLDDLLNDFSFEVVTRTLVTAGIDEARVADFKRYLPPALAGITKSMYDPTGLMRHIPTPDNRRTNHAIRQVRATIADAVAYLRTSGEDHGDMLSTLVRDGHGLSDQEICDEAMALLVAGTETITSALSWAIHLMTESPEVQQRVQVELDEVLSGRPITVGDVPKLDYLRRMFTEILRLYPPGWLVSRRTLTEVRLGDVVVPARRPVFVCLYTLHRRKENFPDPDRFDPDRWLPERAKSLPREAYLPFSTGMHRCPGDHFAWTMASVLLAALCQRWHLTAAGDPITPTAAPTLRPSHLDVIVTSRGADRD